MIETTQDRNQNRAMIEQWDPQFAARSPMFLPLRETAHACDGVDWPDCATLNAMAATAITPPVNACGMPIRFVPQSSRQTVFDEKYEPRIYLRGEVQVRQRNWHDLFNALVWLTYPLAKAALNQRHYSALREVMEEASAARTPGATANRGPQQDALTLLDEGGVIVASMRAELTGLLRDHEWKTLFWRRRAALAGTMDFFLFGHALYEKALRPYVGMTGRGIVLEVDSEFFLQSPVARLGTIDMRLARLIGDPGRLTSTADLLAVPVLGVPGWFAGNEVETFYENTAYFRPAQRITPPG